MLSADVALGGRHLPAGLVQAARADDVLLLGLQWLQSLPQGADQGASNGKAGEGLHGPVAQKLLMLAAGAFTLSFSECTGIEVTCGLFSIPESGERGQWEALLACSF